MLGNSIDSMSARMRGWQLGFPGSLNPNHPYLCPNSQARPRAAHTVPRLQLMSMILIMVMMKKDSASISAFTRTAVMRNSSRMATRLPKIRTD